MKRLPALMSVVFLMASLAVAQANLYSQWSNFPQSPNFFPLVVWVQDPNRSLGSGAPFGSTVAVAMKGVHMNVALAIDGGSGGEGWPSAFGKDCGTVTCNQFHNFVANGIYVIPNVDNSGNTSPTSVASVQAIASAQNASQYLIGYNLGDEPQSNCSGVPSIPGTVSTVAAFDNAPNPSTRPVFLNNTDWVF